MDVLLLILRILLVVLLYGFLTAIFLILWRDLRQAIVTTETNRPHAHLVVLDCEPDTLAVGSTFPLQPVTSIGRSPANTIPIHDTYTSGHHSLLAWREGQWWLEDQGSRNGTLLNDARISTPTIVNTGDIIGIGQTRLRLEIE
jgi:pSer/pThr/pTyr-binding forkhead associated (FHA) protein